MINTDPRRDVECLDLGRWIREKVRAKRVFPMIGERGRSPPDIMIGRRPSPAAGFVKERKRFECHLLCVLIDDFGACAIGLDSFATVFDSSAVVFESIAAHFKSSALAFVRGI